MSDKKTDETKTEAAPAVAAATAKPRNITRESLELTLAARYEAEGKSKADAKKLAVARAFEMCPD